MCDARDYDSWNKRELSTDVDDRRVLFSFQEMEETPQQRTILECLQGSAGPVWQNGK